MPICISNFNDFILISIYNYISTAKFKKKFFMCVQNVFEYLAHLLGVAKGTLTKRMKQLAKKKEVSFWTFENLVLKFYVFVG